jgi:nucleoside-diphosphate-sugar epimerase
MNVLISGATGYLGYNFSKFVANKDINLHIILRPNSNARDLHSLENAKFYLYNKDFASIEKIFLENDINVVFHLANNYQKRNDSDYLLELDDVCNKLTTHLLEATRNKKNFVGFINVGTIWQLNKRYENAYTLFKIFQDDLARLYSHKHGVKVMSLLLTDSYGPRDWRPKFLNQLFTSVSNNHPFFIDNPTNELGLIFIDDICEALYHSIKLLSNQTKAYENYKLEAIESSSIIEIVHRIEKLLGYKLDVTFGDGMSFKKNLDSIETQSLPGWKARIDIDTGLKYFLGLEE